MSAARLSALDESFLTVESPTAHMHVGWMAAFKPPPRRPAPRFEEIREHIAGRLSRAPRYRQKLAPVPLDLHDPVWVDDCDFDLDRHVRHSRAGRLTDVADRCMSEQLPRDRPLWEIRIADRLADGRIGVVGKAHHCMVDGIAAVELASLLLDPEPDPPAVEPEGWEPEPAPDGLSLLVRGAADRLREQLDLARVPARVAGSPRRLLDAPGQARRALRALGDSLRPAKPVSPLNEPISPDRHLAAVGRSLDDLRRIKSSFGTTVNDVLLAVSAGGVRRFLRQRGEDPVPLKTMVPVNVRETDGEGELGNRISFIFVDLPCDEPDPVRRLKSIHLATSERKQAGEAQGANAVLDSVSYAPRTVKRAVSRLVASPRAFNLVVSNIPGPPQPMYMLGCELDQAYPVVPISDDHAVSIGMTTVRDGAYFGLYADRRSLPDADDLAAHIDESIDELLALS